MMSHSVIDQNHSWVSHSVIDLSQNHSWWFWSLCDRSESLIMSHLWMILIYHRVWHHDFDLSQMWHSWMMIYHRVWHYEMIHDITECDIMNDSDLWQSIMNDLSECDIMNDDLSHIMNDSWSITECDIMSDSSIMSVTSWMILIYLCDSESFMMSHSVIDQCESWSITECDIMSDLIYHTLWMILIYHCDRSESSQSVTLMIWFWIISWVSHSVIDHHNHIMNVTLCDIWFWSIRVWHHSIIQMSHSVMILIYHRVWHHSECDEWFWSITECDTLW